VAVIRPALPEDHFTRVPNAWLRDPNLDPAPKAYLAYLLTHAAGYRCSTSQASRDMGVNRSTVSAWNSKLVERGYFLAVEQPRAGAGRFAENDYTLTPCTASAPPLPENPSLFPRETAQSTDTVKPRPDRHLRSVDAEVEAAQVIASEHYEATGKLGGSRAFLALRGIVAGALKAGHAPEQIRPALAHLRQRGRPVTNSTLGPLLADPRLAESVTGARYGPRAPIPADADAHRGAF
jgi:hypothetical protein